MTRALLTGLLGGILWAAASALPASAAEPDAKPHSYIVLVGISEYADPQIKPRPHAEDDAKALYDLFKDPRYNAGGPDHVRLLLGKPDPARKSEPATRENILKALRWAAKGAKRDDLVVFAFFGQGGPFADRTCYFTSDSTFKDRNKTALAAGDIEHELDNLKSLQFCAFVDVNFKGYDARGAQVSDAPRDSKLYQEFMGKDEEDNKLLGRVVFLATDGFTPSLDLKDQGVFARVLANGLKGAADKEGYEPDGSVTVDELIEHVNKELPAQAREHGKTREEQEQQHHILQARSSNFVLTRNPEAAPRVARQVEKLAEMARDEKLTRELAAEGEKLLARMPKLIAYRDLRRNYQRLVDGRMSLDEFTKARTDLFQSMKLRRSDSLAYAAKVIQATQIVKENYVKETNQGELVEAGIRGLYRRIEEDVPEEIRPRLAKAKTMSEEELTTLLADVRQRLGRREDLANQKDLDITLKRLLARLDPYTTFIDAETLSRFRQETDGRFTGIGISINSPSRGVLHVVTPLKGSPAYKAGLKAGDSITHVTREMDSNGKPLPKTETIATKDIPLNDVVKIIQGKPGTKVKVTVEREGAGSLEFEITREVIELESVLGIRRNDDDEWEYYIDPADKICYVRLNNFARFTARDLNRLMNKLEKKGINGFILDLRFNPGGLLSSAVEIADMFVDDGLIVSIRPRGGREQVYTGESQFSRLRFPMVCLVNGLSASGSEIVAACLQDHHRAIIMGERSYGKGSVQNILPFEGGELKLTTATFWRPNGRNLNKASTKGQEEDVWGVTPDRNFVLKLEPGQRDLLYKHQHDAEIIPRRDVPPPAKETRSDFQDKQLQMAVDYLRSQIRAAAKAPGKKAG